MRYCYGLGEGDELTRVFFDKGVCIPIKSYSQAVSESTYLQRFNDWRLKYKWSSRAVNSITIHRLVESAKYVNGYYGNMMKELLESDSSKLSIFDRKRLVPKLRFCAGRLLFL